jgi:hypothetical protein
MSGLTHSTNPIAIAKETVAISKEVDSPVFQKVAKWTLIVSAALTALVGVAHTVRSLVRDMAGKPQGRDHGRTYAEPVPIAAGNASDDMPPRRDGSQERSWVNKARAADRTQPSERHGGRH